MRQGVAVLLLFTLGCPAAVEVPEPAVEEEVAVEADAEAIRAATDTFTEAFNAGDVEGMVAAYAEDAILMPPEEPAVTGTEALRAWHEGFFEQFTLEGFTLTVEEVVVAGDWAFTRGAYTIALVPKPEGERMEDAGKYVTIWSRQPDGSWKVLRDIWNSDGPPGEGG